MSMIDCKISTRTGLAQKMLNFRLHFLSNSLAARVHKPTCWSAEEMSTRMRSHERVPSTLRNT